MLVQMLRFMNDIAMTAESKEELLSNTLKKINVYTEQNKN